MATQGEKPRFTGTYTLDPLIIRHAAQAMAGTKGGPIVTTTTLVALVLVNLLFIFQPDNYMIYAIVLFVVAVAIAIYFSNRGRHMRNRLARYGITAAERTSDSEEKKYRINVYGDRIEVLGPYGEDTTHELGEIDKFWNDEECIVLRFRKGGYAVIPRSSMSTNRYLNLIDFLEKRPR